MLTWTKEADGSFISADERFLLHRRADRYFDVVPAEGSGAVNKKRLSLKAAKELAEQLANDSTEGDYWHLPIVRDCTGQPLPAETLARLHDGDDVGSAPCGELPAGMRAILSPVAEQRTKKPKAATVTVERPDGEKTTLGIAEANGHANGKFEGKEPTIADELYRLNAEAEREAKAKPKKAKKLRGGIGGEPKAEPAPAPKAPVLTPTQIQAKLDELVWRHGSNVTEWLDYPKLLADAGLHPEQVTDHMIDSAAEHAKERQAREAKQTDGPKEYRLGSLYIGACVQVTAGGFHGGSKAEIVAANDSEIKVKAIDEYGKASTQHWSPGTMVRVLSRDEFKAKPRESLTRTVAESTIAETPATETPEDAEEITVMQVKHADAVALLKTWYPTADGFNAKKTEAKLRSLPERLASDPEAERPADKHAVKLLETIIAAADAGDEIEVAMNGDGASEMDGAVVVRKVAKKAKGRRPNVEEAKEAKAAKNGNGHGKKTAAPAKAEKKPAKAMTGKKPSKSKESRTDGSMSGLDAAYKVLASSGKPMGKQDLLEAIIKKGYWQPNKDAKTPADTIKAAIHTEINKKGKESRFKKTGPGTFAAVK